MVGRTLLVADAPGDSIRALVIEVEAYGGTDDPASHAAFRPGGRARIMWEAPGTIYVYAAYGVYPCLNVVTGQSGEPAAVLIRGVWREGDDRPTFGPGRAGRILGVTSDDHGESCCGRRFRLSWSRCDLPVQRTPRVGVKRGTDLLWRYVVAWQ